MIDWKWDFYPGYGLHYHSTSLWLTEVPLTTAPLSDLSDHPWTVWLKNRRGPLVSTDRSCRAPKPPLLGALPALKFAAVPPGRGFKVLSCFFILHVSWFTAVLRGAQREELRVQRCGFLISSHYCVPLVKPHLIFWFPNFLICMWELTLAALQCPWGVSWGENEWQHESIFDKQKHESLLKAGFSTVCSFLSCITNGDKEKKTPLSFQKAVLTTSRTLKNCVLC